MGKTKPEPSRGAHAATPTNQPMNQELEAGSVTVAASVDIGAEVDVRRAFDHSETICIVPDTTISLSAYKSGEETNLLQLH